jgi:hypothetical protein
MFGERRLRPTPNYDPVPGEKLRGECFLFSLNVEAKRINTIPMVEAQALKILTDRNYLGFCSCPKYRNGQFASPDSICTNPGSFTPRGAALG